MSWYNSDWKYRKKLSVVAEKVTTASCGDYPFWFITEDEDILSNCRSDYNDLIFTASDGSTKLNHELVRFKKGDIVSVSTQANATPYLQGITKDDSGNFYITAIGASRPGIIIKYNSSWVQQASHQLDHDDDHVTQIADIFWKDGYLYVADATVEDDIENSQGGRIVRFNDSDLSYDSVVLAETNLGYFTEGVVFYDGHWWLTFGQEEGNLDGTWIRRYSSSWVFEKEYPLAEIPDAQGLGFIEIDGHPYALLTTHNSWGASSSRIYAYRYYSDLDSFTYFTYWPPRLVAAEYCQGFHVENLDGSSVIFADRVDANFRTTDLSSLIEAEQCSAWVQIPTLTPSSEIYVYYGNTDATDGQSVSPIWADFVGLLHDARTDIGPNSLVTVRDSNNPTYNWTSGKLGSGSNAATGYLSITNAATRLTGTMWASVWANYDAIPLTVQYFISQTAAGETLATNCLYTLGIRSDKKLDVFWEYGSGSNVANITTNPVSINSGEWHRFTFIRTVAATTTLSIYYDGDLVQTWTGLTNPAGGTSTILTIAEGISQKFDGKLSELWISSESFDGDKEKTLFNNQSSPSSFFVLGVRERMIYPLPCFKRA